MDEHAQHAVAEQAGEALEILSRRCGHDIDAAGAAASCSER
jgi:hypothetical protein